MKRTGILIALIFALPTLYGQSFYDEYPGICLKFTAGGGLPLSSYSSWELTDNLVNYYDDYIFSENFSLTWFLNRRWGVEFSYQYCNGKNSSNKQTQFNTILEDMYGEQFYITSTEPGYSSGDYSGEAYHRGFMSLVYRIEREKSFITPSFSVGTTFMELGRRRIELKERNSNNYKVISIRPDIYSNNFLTLGTGVSVGRRLVERIYVTMDFQYTYFRTNFNYKVETRDPVLSSYSKQLIPYNNYIHSLSFGFGITYILKYKQVPNENHPYLYR